MKKKKERRNLTILRRRLGQSNTRQMEPFARARIIVTRHHIPETNLIAVAITRLSILISIMDGFFIFRCRQAYRRGGFLV